MLNSCACLSQREEGHMTVRKPATSRRRALFLAVGACMSLLGASGPARSQALPSYYPDDYKQLVEASKKEEGLLIYSVLAQYNWAPVIADFNKLYPWIKVSTLDLQGEEVFQRYY